MEKTQLQMQNQKLGSDRRELQLEVQRLREDKMRLKNDNEMYRNDHQVAMSKYEREIKQRVDAEVRFLEKSRWADALQEDLNKERKQSMHYATQLQEANTSRETVQVEVDQLRTQVKMQEAQAGAFKQGALEAAQQKQRHEQQVSNYKQNIERQGQKINELKDQLEQEVETNKRSQEMNSNIQREMRKLETQFEDESHSRKELQNERDTLRERLDKMDKETSDLTDERRSMHKEINDLSMKHRTDQIELKRYTEQTERTEKSLEKLEDAHRKLVDAHRSLNVETEYLREDCQHFDEQLKKESELRKVLQHEKKQLTGQLQTIQIERDTGQSALQSATKELQEVTEKMVKLESIVRDTKAAMTKVNLEHQVELKAHTQKVSILERVIADERNERRNLVAETQSLVEKREDSLDLVQKKDLEIGELKRHRLEKEEEADRYRILLKAQEQRNSEQLVTVDKYHAAVASHDAEMRQMHVLLECEREEAQRKLSELQMAYASTKHTLEQRIDGWKFAFEDVLSRLNFNPATTKIQILELENFDMQKELKEAKAVISGESEKLKEKEDDIKKRDNRIKELRDELGSIRVELEDAKAKVAECKLHAERQAYARCDAEQRMERIKQNTEAFDDMKTSLEGKIRDNQKEVERLKGFLTIPKADAEVQVFVMTTEEISQTDLSYQYLESSERLQNDPRRLQRLDALQKASHFVDDAGDKRSFGHQPSEPGSKPTSGDGHSRSGGPAPVLSAQDFHPGTSARQQTQARRMSNPHAPHGPVGNTGRGPRQSILVGPGVGPGVGPELGGVPMRVK
jgi:chromosome segregation ATPase